MDISAIEQRAVARKVANTFQYAVSQNDISPIDFVCLWLKSKVAERLYQMNGIEIAQSWLWLYNSCLGENKTVKLEKKEDNDKYVEMMYWLGYILQLLMFKQQMAPAKLAVKYDIVKIMDSYSILHTISNTAAIDFINNEFRR